MSKITIFIGALLIGLALFGYFGAEQAHRSMTAWIPALVGLPLLVCGIIARNAAYRKVVMHIAVVFGLLGMLAAGARGLMKFGVLVSPVAGENRRAVIIVWIMFLLCAVFLGLAIKSFVDARRRRDSE